MDEIDRNYEAFVEELPAILETHTGQYALLHAQKIVAYYDNALLAVKAGSQRFLDGEYSVQEVAAEIENLGFYSYAGHPGQA